MEIKTSTLVGKILYGSLFVLLIPILLVFWAVKTEQFITLPAVHSPYFGLFLSLIGSLLILRGMLDLWIYGEGLPMNAYPPKRFVTEGIYRYLSHPIYVGAGILSIGLSIFLGSASGLWLVSPIFILGMFALVLGYEKDAIDSLFKPQNYTPLVAIPPDIDKKATVWEQLSFIILVVLPWLFLYELITFKGVPTNAIETYLPFENQIPIWDFTEIFYILAYPFVLLLPFFIKNTQILRGATIAGILMTITGGLCQFFLPFVASLKTVHSDSIFGQLMTLERQWSSAAGAFPSFHAAWAFFVAYYCSKSLPQWKNALYGLAILISVSCFMTGMHSVVDVVAGWLLFRFSVNYAFVWQQLKNGTEKIANSYHEWYFGQFRVLNHAIYAGIAGFLGIFIIGILTNQPLAVFLIGVSSMIGAGLWAQYIEGSAKLSRPFGYFGCILGGVIANVFISPKFGIDPWFMLSAFAVASPWVQGSGRFRCWVQGCCHGKQTTSDIGICYHHPRSRVLVISEMGDLPLHNTQLYSVSSCFLIGFILTSLWYADVHIPMIIGLYFILTGLSRFVEEHFRGEPQTPIYYGLRLYQWLAIGFLIGGMLLATVDFHAVKPVFDKYVQTSILAVIFGSFTAFLMGMDFPFSTKRFSRLASTD